MSRSLGSTSRWSPTRMRCCSRRPFWPGRPQATRSFIDRCGICRGCARATVSRSEGRDRPAARDLGFVGAGARRRRGRVRADPPGAPMLVALSEQRWGALKIGGGTAPVRVPEGWMTPVPRCGGRVGQRSGAPAEGALRGGRADPDPTDISRVVARSASRCSSPSWPRRGTGSSRMSSSRPPWTRSPTALRSCSTGWPTHGSASPACAGYGTSSGTARLPAR